jgi:hypothetical protein
VQLLRTLLRLDPWVPHGRLWLASALPKEIDRLSVRGMPVAGARIDVEIKDGSCQVSGIPDTLQLVHEPRHPLTASLT